MSAENGNRIEYKNFIKKYENIENQNNNIKI
jgi:hypothetical protein